MVVVRLVLITFVLRITSETKMWLKAFIILTLDIKIRKISSSMLDQVVSKGNWKKYTKYKTLRELTVFKMHVYQIC